MTVILTAVGNRWDSHVATVLEPSREVRIARRCADLADLIATAAAGLGRVALVSDELRGLDRTAVHTLRAAGVVVVGLAGRDEASERHLRQLGIARVVSVDASLSDLESALLGTPAADDSLDGLGATETDPLEPEVGATDGPLGTERRGQLVAVWGPAGAPGRTTIAVHLAAEAAARGRSTLLVDADTYGACVAQVLSLLDEAPGLAAAARGADHGTLDVAALSRMAPTVAPNLRVLTGIPTPARWTEIREAALGHVLDQARLLAEVVVVDTGFCLERDEELSYDTRAPRRNATTLTTLEAADSVIAVGSADPVGITRLVRGLDDLTQAVDCARPHVVVNRVRGSSVGSGPQTRVRGILARFAGVDSAVLVPDDPETLDAALLAGRTLVESAPGSAVRLAVAEIGHQVLGLAAAEPRRSRLRRVR